MNQKIHIQILVLLLTFLQACQKDPQPSTIIKATIKDEKGNPLANIPFRFDAYRYYSTGFVYVGGSGKKETFFDVESQSDKNGKIEFSKTIPNKNVEVYVSFRFGEEFRSNLYKLKFIKSGSVQIDSVNAYLGFYPIASYPKPSDYSLPLILDKTNEYEIILYKK